MLMVYVGVGVCRSYTIYNRDILRQKTNTTPCLGCSEDGGGNGGGGGGGGLRQRGGGGCEEEREGKW